jgi:hypothetical protein
LEQERQFLENGKRTSLAELSEAVKKLTDREQVGFSSVAQTLLLLLNCLDWNP